MQNNTVDVIIPKTLPLDVDKREIVTYPDSSFPFEIWYGDMSQYLGGGLPPHWHREIEYGLVTEGRVEYVSPSGTVILEKGEAVIVKSQAMHYTESLSTSPCVLYTISFLPFLIAGSEESLVYRKYILPFLSLDFHALKIEDEKVTVSLEKLRRMDKEKRNYELEALSLLYTLWLDSLSYLERKEIKRSGINTNPGEENIKKALGFIYTHYSEKISIDDIASASFMSRNSLFRHFKSSFGKTPIEVLNEHRLSVAASLLKKGMRITEVSQRVGFTTPSYFIKCFHDRFSVSPSQYRREAHKLQHSHKQL